MTAYKGWIAAVAVGVVFARQLKFSDLVRHHSCERTLSSSWMHVSKADFMQAAEKPSHQIKHRFKWGMKRSFPFGLNLNDDDHINRRWRMVSSERIWESSVTRKFNFGWTTKKFFGGHFHFTFCCRRRNSPCSLFWDHNGHYSISSGFFSPSSSYLEWESK